MASDETSAAPDPFRAILGFILVGMAWGFTTPFIRKAAVAFKPTPRPLLRDPSIGWVRKKLYGAFFTTIDMLRTPAYLLPLVINLTGSVWFFLLIGKAGKPHLGRTMERKIFCSADLLAGRIESHGSDHEFPGVFVHGAW